MALDARREREIVFGSDEDFVIDTVGDQKVKKQKVLETSEILRNKSKVPALSERIKRKTILKKRASELMILSGRLMTESKLKASVARDGLLRAESADLWGEISVKAPKVPIVSASQPSIPSAVATKPPKTLSEAPVRLHAKNIRNLADYEDGGKSYNPVLEDWKLLIEYEFGNESDLELKRQRMEEHQKRIEHLITTLDDNEVQDMDEVQDDDNVRPEIDDDKYKLSVNPRTEVKIKSRAKRNKATRHRNVLALHSKLRELKAQLADLCRLNEIQVEVDKKFENKKEAKLKTFTRHGKHYPTFKPIEVKLSDELTGNLRSLRPEGNLFYDLMNKLQMQGKVEARVPVIHKNRYKPKYVVRSSFRRD